ncbi:MAG: hypothetical protein K8F28_10705, partial [Ignavibacteriaceae bacterium]|nr:hypothetical protein [Ignavibacteriaceae bacterium]
MKKIIIILFALFLSCETLFAQIRDTTFPIIAFFDGYVSYKIPPFNWGKEFNAEGLKRSAETISEYFDSLGVTHSVSWADEVSTTPSPLNRKRKILNMHLEWSKDYPHLLGKETGTYIKAQGQDREAYPFQIGGSSIFNISPDYNFGFGTKTSSSVWFNSTNPDLIPKWITPEIAGSDTTVYDNGEWVTVRFALPSGEIGEQTTPNRNQVYNQNQDQGYDPNQNQKQDRGYDPNQKQNQDLNQSPDRELKKQIKNDENGERVLTINSGFQGKKHIVYGKIFRMMFTNGNLQHYFAVKAKIDKRNYPDDTEVFRVQIRVLPASNNGSLAELPFDPETHRGALSPKSNFLPGEDGDKNSKVADEKNQQHTEETSSPLLKDFEFIVRKRDFTSDGFQWITLTDPNLNFKEFGAVTVDKNIEIGILYSNLIPVQIDAISVHDELYQSFFYEKGAKETVRSQLKSFIDSLGSTELFGSFYDDEPFLLTANVRKEYTKMVRELAPGNKSFDIAGASGVYWRWHFGFDRTYAALPAGFYKNYFIFDNYPFQAGHPRGFQDQTAVQKAIENFIEYKNERVLPRDETGREDPWQFMGLLTAIEAAKNFTPDLSDDIPLTSTIQVSGSRGFNPEKGEYVRGALDLRFPSKQEIALQGNLALSFGAKGFMFYMGTTRVDYGMITFGLFDDATNPYNENSASLNKQRADNPQIPNERYWALKEFLESVKPIEKFILRTSWAGTFSGNTQTYRRSAGADWIARVNGKRANPQNGTGNYGNGAANPNGGEDFSVNNSNYDPAVNFGNDTPFEKFSDTETGLLQLTRWNNFYQIEPDTIFLYITNKIV